MAHSTCKAHPVKQLLALVLSSFWCAAWLLTSAPHGSLLSTPPSCPRPLATHNKHTQHTNPATLCSQSHLVTHEHAAAEEHEATESHSRQPPSQRLQQVTLSVAAHGSRPRRQHLDSSKVGLQGRQDPTHTHDTDASGRTPHTIGLAAAGACLSGNCHQSHSAVCSADLASLVYPAS